MTQRVINDSFWTDPYVEELDPSEKLLFLYLLTNPLCNIAGIYEIKIKRIAYETGFDKEMIDKILNRFVRDEKIFRCDDWILLRNFAKNQSPNPNVKKGMQRIIDDLPDKIKALKGFESLSHFTLLNLTLPNLTLLNSTEDFSFEGNSEIISENNFSLTEVSSDPEDSNIPPAVQKPTIHSTIHFVKSIVIQNGIIYSSDKMEAEYAKAINSGKDFGENAQLFGKTRMEFVELIVQASTKSDFWKGKLNNCKTIYSYYARVLNEVKGKIEKDIIL